VLQGEATLEVDGQVLLLREREGGHVPAGAAHQIKDVANSELQFLVTSEPPSHGDREEVIWPRRVVSRLRVQLRLQHRPLSRSW